jgi:hypothetical protein
MIPLVRSCWAIRKSMLIFSGSSRNVDLSEEQDLTTQIGDGLEYVEQR